MSAISQKSISGITSITSPAGTDDQISLHTSNTNEALKIDGAGNLHLNNHVNTTGVSTASNFKTGSSNLHSTGLNVGNTFVHSTGINGSSADIDDFISVGNNIHLGNAGVVTATSFVGSGAALTGIDATSIKDSGGNVKIQAQASGAIHSGVSTFQDIDVDGHTNLDNVSIAGIVTALNFVKTDGTTVGGAMTGYNNDPGENNVTTFIAGRGAGNNIQLQNGDGQSAFGNVLIGDGAGGSAQNGYDYNVAVGSYAHNNLRDGSYNIAIGYGANRNVSTQVSSNTIAIGYETLINFVGGGTAVNNGRNTVVGHAAAGTLVSGGNNLVLGMSAEPSATAMSNEITLGNSNISHFRIPGIGVSFGNNGAVIAGVVTATSFSGNGANLTGVSGPEVYGFIGIGSNLQVRTTNGGADDITGAQYDAFEQVLFAPSGITFSINNNGKLIATF